MTVEETPPPGQTVKGYAKGRARRQQILDAAMVLFGEVGYRSASLREIAARSGMSHPGLLHHFPTKESLLLAILQRRDQADASSLHKTEDDGVALLRDLLALVELNSRRRAVVELYAVLSVEAVAPDHPAHDYFVRRYQETLASTSRAYRLAADQGALRADVDPSAAGAQLVAVMDGLQVQWLLDGGATDMAGIVRSHIGAQLTVPL